MSTKPVFVTQAWSQIAIGPASLAINLGEGSPNVCVAVSDGPPDYNYGHPADAKLIMNVDLDDGELLFAVCKKGNGFLIVTD